MPSVAQAQQNYPNRPIRLVCPYASGSSSNDILGRQLAQRLSTALGQQIVVDNRAGASGQIGVEMVVRAAPDGYTLLLATNGALAMVDILSGQVQLYCAGVTSALPQVKSGKLRFLAVTTLNRSPVAPDVPTAHEQGLTGFDVASWLAMMTPAKTPPHIIQRLHGEIARITNDPEMKNAIIAQGSEPAVQTPAELAAFLKLETVKWAKVIKSAGITAL